MAESVATLEAQLASLHRQLAQAKAQSCSSQASPSTPTLPFGSEGGTAIPEATLVAMLEHEAQSRLSSITQQRYAEVEAANGDASWMEVTEELQRATVRAFGFGCNHDNTREEEAAAVAALRLAAPRHPEIAFWVRHNRARRGDLARHDLVPAIALAPLEVDPVLFLLDAGWLSATRRASPGRGCAQLLVTPREGRSAPLAGPRPGLGRARRLALRVHRRGPCHGRVAHCFEPVQRDSRTRAPHANPHLSHPPRRSRRVCARLWLAEQWQRHGRCEEGSSSSSSSGSEGDGGFGRPRARRAFFASFRSVARPHVRPPKGHAQEQQRYERRRQENFAD